MGDIFKVVLDLSLMGNDKMKNQTYLAMADTTKMKTIREFKLWVKFLFSLECPVELSHEGAALHDLDDIRVLSLLNVVKVRPLENGEEENQARQEEDQVFISKFEEYNRRYGDGDPEPVPDNTTADCNNVDFDRGVCCMKSHKVDESVQTPEVLSPCTHETSRNLCCPSFPANDRTCNPIPKPRENLPKSACHFQENKTFKLGNKTGMAENLKLGTLMQQRYYGWCGISDRNFLPARCPLQNNIDTLEAKPREQNHLVNRNAKPDGDVACGVEKKLHTCHEFRQGGMKVLENYTCKGIISDPVKLKEAKDHELCDREFLLHDIKSKGCSMNIPDSSGTCGLDPVPATAQKLSTSHTTNSPEEESTAEANCKRELKSLSEILKMLNEAAVERSKILACSNAASQNAAKARRVKGVCAAAKTKYTPSCGGLNFKNTNVKQEVTPKTPGTPDRGEKWRGLNHGCNTKAVSPHFQCNMPKKEEETKDSENSGSEDKNQACALFEVCEKLDGNEGERTESAGQTEDKVGAPNPPPQCNPTKKKKKKSKNKKKNKTKNTSPTHSSARGCENVDNGNGDKIGGERKMESETALSDPVVKHGDVNKKIVLGDDFVESCTSDSAFRREYLSPPPSNEMTKVRAVDDGGSPGVSKPTSRVFYPSMAASKPICQFQCRSLTRPTRGEPKQETGGDPPRNDVSDSRFSDSATVPNARWDFEATEPVLEGAEDKDKVNRVVFSDETMTEGVAVPTFPEQKIGKNLVRDVEGLKEDNRGECALRPGCSFISRDVTLPRKISYNAIVEEAKGVNAVDGGGGGLALPKARDGLGSNHSWDGAGNDGAGASPREEGPREAPRCRIGRARLGGWDWNSCGPQCNLQNDVIPLLYRRIQALKSEGFKDLYEAEGSVPDARVKKGEEPPGEGRNPKEPKDPGAGENCLNKALPGYWTLPHVLKACLVALVLLIVYLYFKSF